MKRQNIFFTTFFSLIFFVVLTACGGGGGGSGSNSPKPQDEAATMATQYFPLTDAFTWQYQIETDESNGDYDKEHNYTAVDGIITFNGALAYKVKSNVLEPYLESGNSIVNDFLDFSPPALPRQQIHFVHPGVIAGGSQLVIQFYHT